MLMLELQPYTALAARDATPFQPSGSILKLVMVESHSNQENISIAGKEVVHKFRALDLHWKPAIALENTAATFMEFHDFTRTFSLKFHLSRTFEKIAFSRTFQDRNLFQDSRTCGNSGIS